MNKLIYLASPYSHKDAGVREQRFQDICRIAAKLHDEGHILFVPIAMSHPLETVGGAKASWEAWMRADKEILSRCDELWVAMIDGWKESAGVTAEIALAKDFNKTIKYIQPEIKETA